MATSILPLLLLGLLAATASARPCKTLFYFSATTTTTYYPSSNSLPRNPSSNSIPVNQNPRFFTLIFTSSITSPLSDSRRPFIHFDSDPAFDGDSQSSPKTTSSDFPLKFYSSVSSSIRERTKDIMSVVGALLFGVGCGALTAAVMYFVWALYSPSRFDFCDVSSSSDDDDDDEVAATKRKLGYQAIPTKPDDDLKKPAPPVKEKEVEAANDPSKPKRPPSAFFVFMEDFRKEFKEKNPNNKSVAAVGKAGGSVWKSMSEEEKAPFVAAASKQMKEYELKMEAYNKKLAGGDVDESVKSKSEVHDEYEDVSSSSDDDDDDYDEVAATKRKLGYQAIPTKPAAVNDDLKKPALPTKEKEVEVAEDTSKPKRAPSAFFVFMKDFRKEFKEKNPNNKSVAAVGKAGGSVWKSMSEEEKAPFVAVASKLKKEYELKMDAYNKKLAGGDDDESDKVQV